MRKALLAISALSLALGACGGGEGSSSSSTSDGPPPALKPMSEDAPPAKRSEFHVDLFRFGDAWFPDGTVTNETSALASGKTAALSMLVRHAPDGTEVRAVWKDVTKDAVVGEEVKPILKNGFVAFQKADLPDGKYRVEKAHRNPVITKWETLGAHDFTVGAVPKAP